MKTTLTILALFIVLGVKAQVKIISMQSASDYFDSYNKNKADTAHYWVKNISTRNYYITALLPRYDTVRCYSLVILTETVNNGPETLETAWWKIWAVRDKEQIIGYCDITGAPIKRKMIQTILINPISRW